MGQTSSYQEYARIAIRNYRKQDPARRNIIVDSLDDLKVNRVLDIGCGTGQHLLPFIEKKNAFCVGLDIGEELGEVGKSITEEFDCRSNLVYCRSSGETLPFADDSFDVVMSRIAITQMNNQKVMAEAARVLKKEGVFLLKTHSPAFFAGMIKDRLSTLSPKQIAYPIIAILGGGIQILTGKYPDIDFWKGREVFQTEAMIKRELRKHSMEIKGYLPDTNIQTPSYYIVNK